LKSKLTACSVTDLAWMLEPKEHYGKLHRQHHSAPKTTTHCPAIVLKFMTPSRDHKRLRRHSFRRSSPVISSTASHRSRCTCGGLLGFSFRLLAVRGTRFDTGRLKDKTVKAIDGPPLLRFVMSTSQIVRSRWVQHSFRSTAKGSTAWTDPNSLRTSCWTIFDLIARSRACSQDLVPQDFGVLKGKAAPI
jgi:hypothetical protein